MHKFSWKRTAAGVLGALLLALLPLNPAGAAESTEAAPAAVSTEVAAPAAKPVDKAGLATSAGIVRWVLSTFAVLAVIILLAYILKKSRLVKVKNAQLQVESLLSLGPKERVVLLQAQGRQLLLGVTAQQITMLCDLSEKPQAQPGIKGAAKSDTEPSEDAAAEFAALLEPKRELSEEQSAEEAESAEPGSADEAAVPAEQAEPESAGGLTRGLRRRRRKENINAS